MKRWSLLILPVLLMSGACSGADKRGSPAESPKASEELVATVASYDLSVGEQRFIVGLLTPDQSLIGHGSVLMRFAYLGTSSQGTATVGKPVKASFLPIPEEDGARAPRVKEKPEVIRGSSLKGVYSARATFDKAGFWGVQIGADVRGLGPRTARASFAVGEKHLVPAAGDQAPRSDNLTLATAGAPPKAIDSRASESGQVPDPELHQLTVAQALEQGRPVLLTISTPVYCVSRFCGPITDMVSALAKKYPERAAFIHMEVWKDFEKKEINKAAAEWIFKGENATEPWVFLIGADGKVIARWDNVATAAEIEPLLQQLPKA